MIKFINKMTGSVMYVTETRKKEYEAAGHRPAAVSAKATKQETVKKKGTRKKAGA